MADLYDYTCEVCKGKFSSDRAEDDRLAEHVRVWGFEARPEDRAIVCEICFAQILAWGKLRGLVVGEP